MSRFRSAKHLYAGLIAPPSGALRTGLNFTATGWNDWLWQNRWQAGAWQAVTGGGSTEGLPTANLDSDYWATSVPAGYSYVAHPVTNTPITNQSGPYTIYWGGNMAGGGPVSTTGCTISAVDSVNRTCTATPVNPTSSVPMFIQYGINASDTSAGTYPGGPNATANSTTGSRGIVAIPQGQALSTFDSAVKTQVGGVAQSGSIRVMKMTGVEANCGTSTAWGGGTQASPTYLVTTANRGDLTSGVWTSTDEAISNNVSCNPGGLPIEAAVQLANGLGRDLWWNECWNASPAVVQYNAAYLRDNLSPSLKVYVEISNEVWNAHYLVTGQAGNEAAAANRTSGVAISVGGFSYADRAARLAEKCVEFFGYYNTAFAAASSQPGGAKPTLKRVFAWWHTQGSSVAQQILDYTPPNSSTPLKSNIDVYATSPYFNPVNVDPTCGPPNIYDQARGEGPLFTGLYYDVENICATAAAIRAVCDARGLEYAFYEGGDAEFLDNNASTDMTVATNLARDPAMGTWLGFALSRLEHANPGGDFNYYAFRGSINSRDGTFNLVENILQNPTGTPLAPKYTAYQNYGNGNRYLVPLVGQLFAKAGAQAGDIVGYVRRRLIGSTISVASPFSVADPTATILAITVGTASSFASAGNLTCSITETGGNPSTSNTTSLTCTVTTNTIWTPKTSNKNMDFQDGTGLVVMDVVSDASDVTAIASLARSNGYLELTISNTSNKSNVGLGGPAYTSAQNMYWTNNAVAWSSGTGNLVKNGTALGTLTTWAAGDQLDMFISSTGKFYGRKNNGSWLPTGADPIADTGGIDLSAWLSSVGGTCYPAIHSEQAGFLCTARFASASFLHTPPTGAHDWNS